MSTPGRPGGRPTALLSRFQRSGVLTRYRALRHPPRLGTGRTRSTRLFLARHRTRLGVALLLIAVWVTVRVASPAAPETVSVLVAAHDFPAGHQLTTNDLTVTDWPAQSAPSGRLDPASTRAGQVLAAPMRQGEPLTDARLLGPSLLRGLPPGTVAVPVRLSDPAGATLVRTGDRVDVIAGRASSWSADVGSGGSSFSPATTERAARNALVLGASGRFGAPGAGVRSGTSGLSDGGLGLTGLGGSGMTEDAAGVSATDAPQGESLVGVLVLAVQASEVDRLAAATTGAQVSVVVLP